MLYACDGMTEIISEIGIDTGKFCMEVDNCTFSSEEFLDETFVIS